MKNIYNTFKLADKKLLGFHLIWNIVIIFLGLFFLSTNKSLKLTGDEFGYWSAAAWMAGWDWSPIASLNSYYGYGYGVFLLPILILPFSQSVKYQLSIGLNAILLCGIYWIYYYLISHIISAIDRRLASAIAFLGAIFIGNLYYSQFSIAEVFLSFLTMLLYLLAYKLLYSYNFAIVVSYSFLSLFFLAVHLRTIGSVFVFILFLFLVVFIKERDYKRGIFLVGGMLIFAGAIFYIKASYQDSYLSFTGVVNNMNDFSGRSSQVSSLFSVIEIRKLLISSAGKLFYEMASTYLFLGFAALCILISAIKNIFQRKFENKDWLGLLVLLNFCAIWAVSSVFTREYRWRIDTLVYGRYTDYAVAPLMIVGLLFALYRANYLLAIITAICQIVLTLIVQTHMPYEAAKSHLYVMSPMSAEFIFSFGSKGMLIWGVISVSIFSVVLFGVWISKLSKKIFPVCIVIGLLALSWIYSYINIYQTRCDSWASNDSIREIELSKQIENDGLSDSLYYYSKDNNLAPEYLQMLLGNHTIRTFNDTSETLGFEKGSCIVTTNVQNISSVIRDNYSFYGESNNVQVWIKTKDAMRESIHNTRGVNGDILVMGQIEKDDNPYGISVGCCNYSDYGECIFMTPGTSVLIDLMDSNQLEIDVGIHEGVARYSDGANLSLFYLDDNFAFVGNDVVEVKSKKLWKRYSRDNDFESRARFLLVECGSGKHDDANYDWVMLKNMSY